MPYGNMAGFRPKKGGAPIARKVFCHSAEERDGYLKKGYAIVAITQTLPNGEFSYLLEKGSKWSRMLGSK